MKISTGKIIISIGIIHTFLTPFVYGKQFLDFSQQYFFMINKGFFESQINYETFAAFWCLYFGIILFPLGILLDAIEKENIKIPARFIWSYLSVILAGVYMIPFSGMTVFMLPHAVYMLIKNRKGR